MSVFVLCLSCVNAEEIDDADNIAIAGNDVIGISSDVDDVVSSNDVVKYYVNNSVATSGNGSEDSPFKELNEAIPKAESSQNVEIYVASGNYIAESVTEIYLNHAGEGGSLSLTGYGGDVTFDMQENNVFCFISSDSIVNISNMIFINGKDEYWNYDGIITSYGSLNIINCSFINNRGARSTVVGNVNIYSSVFKDNEVMFGFSNGIDYNGQGYIFNSTFYGSENHGAAIENYGDSIIDKSNFINFTKNCINTYAPLTVVNCIFDKCTGKDSQAPIHTDGQLYLSNNTLINSGNQIAYTQGEVVNAVVDVLDNQTIDRETYGAYLSAKVFDDNGNLVIIQSLDFYINNDNVGTAYYQNGGYSFNYQELLNGTYVASANSSNLINSTIKTATLNIVPPMEKNVKYYVNNSVATSGNGSIDSPFKTLEEAISLANALQNVEIYIASGRYVYNDYTFYMDLNHGDVGGSLSLIGWGDTKPILDSNCSNYCQLFNIRGNANVYMKNLTFVNPQTMLPTQSTVKYGMIYFTNSNLSVEDCNFVGAYRGFAFIAAQNHNYFYCNNCVFENNTWGDKESSANGHCFELIGGGADSIAIINNCTFRNNYNYDNLTASSSWGTAWSHPCISIRQPYNGKLIIANSTFINCSSAFRDFNVYNRILIFDNVRFINNTVREKDYLIHLNGKNTTIKNCYFETNDDFKGELTYNDYQQLLALENNTISENSSVKWFNLYLNSLRSTYYLNVINNSTYKINSLDIPLNATLTDDNGNLINPRSTTKCTFYVGGVSMGTANIDHGVVQVTSKYLFDDGNYTVTSSMTGDYLKVRTGTLDICQPRDLVEVYVAEDGDDETGDGSKENPYKTASKGLDIVSGAVNANLYIKGGYYTIDKSYTFNTFGENLNIIGYGGPVTLDMQNSYAFATVAANSNVYIANITFTKGTSDYYQGVLSANNGGLTLFNCTFVNNKAYNGCLFGNVTVIQCLFKDNSQLYSGSYSVDYYGFGYIYNSTFYGTDNGASIMAYSQGTLDVDSSKFINFTGKAISCGNFYTIVENCIFDNCTGVEYNAPIYSTGSVKLSNNTLINCDNPIAYCTGTVYGAVVEVLENKTIDMESFGVDLFAKVYDDNYNVIRIQSLTFYLNDDSIGSVSTFTDNGYKLSYKKLLNGTYIASASSTYLNNVTIKTATLNIVPLMNKDLYVSTSGSDENDGSEAHPFKTLDKAVSEAVAYNNIIHIADGNYNISKHLEISTVGGTLTIVGSGENTVIDLYKKSNFINSISSDSIVVLENLSIVNGYNYNYNYEWDEEYYENGGSIVNAGNLTINHVSFINSTADYDWWCYGGAIYNYGTLYLLNSKFINCTAAEGGAIYSSKYLYLKNNTMENIQSDNGIILASRIIEGVILTFNDNATQEITDSSVTLNVTVTDDNGNVITGSGVQVTFTLNGTGVATARLGDGIATITTNIALNGEYVLSGTLGTAENNKVKTAILKFNNPDILKEAWVSVDGDDSNDGSKEHPFATIEHALSVVELFDSTIHIMNGTYVCDAKISINNFVNLTIIGEEGCIISVSNDGGVDVFEISGANTVVNAVNLEFDNQGWISKFKFNVLSGTLNLYNVTTKSSMIKSAGTLNIYDSYMGSYTIESSGVLNAYNTVFNLGYRILSSGTIYVNNCTYIKGSNALTGTTSVFENSLFTGGTFSIQNARVDLTIRNCNFTNYSGGGSIITQYNQVRPYTPIKIINNTFESNVFGNSAIQITYSSQIINNTFINNTGERGIVLYSYGDYGVHELYGNKLINNTALNGNYVYIQGGKISGSKYYLTFNDNQTVNVEGYYMTVNATLRDAEGNYIAGPTLYITLNDSSFKQVVLYNGSYSDTIKFADEGQFIVSGYVNCISNPEDLIILNSTLNIRQILEKAIYVDVFGDDENGDGSEDNPYATLSRAFEDINAINTIIYIKPGQYVGDLNSGISFAPANNTVISIIGLPDEDIVEFTNITNGILSISTTGISNPNITTNIKNIQINNLENGVYIVGLGGNANLENISINNCSFSNRIFSFADATLNNVNVFNTSAYNLFTSSGNVLINNSSFKNLSLTYIVNEGVINKGNTGDYNVTINNSVFEDIENQNPLYTRLLSINNSEFRRISNNAFWIFSGSSIVENSIFEENSLNGYRLFTVGRYEFYSPSIADLTISNSVFVNNVECIVYSDQSSTATVNGNWWGRNITSADIPSLVTGGYTFTDWVVADVTPGELPIKENTTITVKFLSNDGSELENVLPARVVEAVADSAIFENGQNYTSYVIDGNEVTFTVLPEALGTVNLTVDNQEFTLNIVKANSTVLLDVFDTTTVDGLTAVATVNDDATGEVTFTLSNGESYTVEIVKGAATLFLDTISAGEYNITAVYGGDYAYYGNEANASFKVTDVIISADDIKFAYKDPNAELVASVADENGNPLVLNLNVELNGENFTVTTGADGQAVIPLGNLTPGKYNAIISYQGLSKAASANALVTVTKSATSIDASDVNIAYKDPSGEIVATIISEHGKGLAVNLNVEFNGKNYTVRTDSNGQAVIPVGNLTPGKYNAKISYKGSINYKASSATVLVTVTKSATSIDASDVNIAYKDPSGEIVATIISEHGKGLAVNLNVEFNGKNYTVRTDSNGQAVIPVGNLTPGTYDAKISYKGSSNYKASSAAIKVVVTKAATSIDAGDVNIAYRDPTGELVATVTNEHGKTLIVTVNIELNGKTYSVRTDANGQAVLSLYDVTPGTYDAKISYKGSSNYKGFTTTAKVVVTKAATSIDAGDVNIAYRDPTGELVATVTNEHGKTLIVTLNIELNGKTYSVRTDANGQAVLSLYDVTPGTYDAKISYKGSNNYQGFTTTAKVVVTKAATSIDASDVKIAYRDPTGELVATVTNEHGKTLIVTVNIELNGKTYSVRTDANGQAVLSLYNVTPGTYNAKISYKGSNNYQGFTTTAKVVVTKSDTIISAPDVSVASGDPDGKLVSTIVNEHGKPLVVNMKVELDGKTYSARSDSNGQINVSTADLAPGSYVAKISYKGSSNYNSASTTANITVKP